MLRGCMARLRAYVARRQLDADHLVELRDHLERETERQLARGLAPDEARRVASIALGNVTTLLEDGRAATRGVWLEQLSQDVRYVARMLRRNPGFTLVAVLSLGFGIGATTTVFSTVDAIDFRPLPFLDPERLVWIAEVAPPDDDVCPRCSSDVSVATAIDWLARSRSYSSAAVLRRTEVTWVRNDAIDRLPVNQITPGFFRLLSVPMESGRDFLPGDTMSGAQPVVIVTNTYWRQQLGADVAAIGRPLPASSDAGTDERLRGATVVGVLPRGFRFDVIRDGQVWTPLRLSASSPRTDRSSLIVARLGTDASLASADAEWRAVFSRLAAEHPDAYRSWGARVEPLRARLGWGAGGHRGLLFGISALVLAVAVVNVAGLVAGRATARRQEIAMRSALGADRRRLLRQLLVEGMSVGLLGGLAGALVAFWGIGFSAHWFRIDAGVAVLDFRVLAFALVVSIVVGVVCASGPALRSSRVNLIGDLRGKGVGALQPRIGSMSQAMIALQIAMGLMLVTAAALLTNDFLKLRYTDLGFDPSGVFVTRISGRSASSGTSWPALAEEARLRVASIPGVRAVTLEYRSAVHPEILRPAEATGFSSVTPVLTAVDPPYFDVWGTKLLRGRAFVSADGAGSERVAIVNQSAASRFWPGQNPLGRQVFVGDSGAPGELLTVVGVTEDAERGELKDRHWPMVYRPLSQATLWHNVGSLQLRVGEAADPAAVLKLAQSGLREVLQRPTDPFRSIESALNDRLRPRRLNAIALNLFAAFGLVLAAIGMYASVSAAVTRRRGELGVRMALGAAHGRVLGQLMLRGMTLALCGVGLGLAGAAAMSQVLRSHIAGTDRLDPLLFAAAAGVMVVAVGAATFIPAWRVMRVDPAEALRST